MSCNTFLTADISSCTKDPVKGLKSKAWIFNRSDIASWTGTNNLFTALTRVAGKRSFTVQGFKDFMNVGSDAAIGEDKRNKYVHFASMVLALATPAEKANIDNADDLVIIVQRNGLETEGAFEIYGRKNGLWKTSQTERANDNVGRTTVEFASRADMEEVYSKDYFWNTNFATTLAALVATETV